MLDGWQNAALEPRIRAAFVLLDAARNPNGPSAADIAAARAGGLSDEATVDAFVVAFGFNLINRLADAFGYDFGDEDGGWPRQRRSTSSRTRCQPSCSRSAWCAAGGYGC
jgi:hypothetical protein